MKGPRSRRPYGLERHQREGRGARASFQIFGDIRTQVCVLLVCQALA